MSIDDYLPDSDPPDSSAPLTFEEIVAIEPRAAELERRALAFPPDTCGVYAQQEVLKAELSELVGWHCGNPRLEDCWDIAFERIFEALFRAPPRRQRSPPNSGDPQ